MSFIDSRTVFLLTGVMGGLMALILLSIKRSYPSSIKGLSEWSYSLVLLFFAGLLSAVRPQLPASVGIWLANLMIWSALYLGYFGSQLFFDIKPKPVPWMSLVFGVWLVSMWFTLADPNYVIRLRMSNMLMLLLFGVHAQLIYKNRLNSSAKVMAFSVLVVIAGIQVMRFVTTFTMAPAISNMDTSLPHLIFILGFAFSILLMSISMILMATDKLRTELELLATRDSLTNALTRRSMNECIEQELQRSKRSQRQMALLVMDLDHFKTINDNHGHQAGDQVLIRFVNNVNKLLRQVDQLGRFGGEEFVALLPETSLQDAQLVAQRIRAVSGAKVGDSAPACTVSIGITTNTLSNDTVDSLLARADAAMYRAKANGRNRVELG
jgi:diguanylate cyclase (GGDEF)-like protein